MTDHATDDLNKNELNELYQLDLEARERWGESWTIS